MPVDNPTVPKADTASNRRLINLNSSVTVSRKNTITTSNMASIITVSDRSTCCVLNSLPNAHGCTLPMMVLQMASLAQHLSLLIHTGPRHMAISLANPLSVSHPIWMMKEERHTALPTALADPLGRCCCFCSLCQTVAGRPTGVETWLHKLDRCCLPGEQRQPLRSFMPEEVARERPLFAPGLCTKSALQLVRGSRV